MLATYVKAMDVLHRLCVIGAGACLVVITVIIPWGVFTRYVLHYGSSWPEPMAVLLMIWFSFLAAAVCYREGLHIGVSLLANTLTGWKRTLLGWGLEILMGVTNLFLLVYGIRLVQATWYQVIADFQVISVGVSYLPVPLGGGIVSLFVIERLWTGKLFVEPNADTMSHVASE
jgi:TRAP-type C4-dicarboxylate transport system permease small subunit